MDKNTFNRVRVAGLVINEIEDLAPKMYPYVEFVKNEDESEGKYSITPLSGEGAEMHEMMLDKYRKWYACVLELLEQYYPEKADDFTKAYESAIPYVTFECKPKVPNSFKMQFEFIKHLTAQKTILSHLFSKMSTMEITESEPDTIESDEVCETEEKIPREMTALLFKQAIKPVLDEEIKKFTDKLSQEKAALDKVGELSEDIITSDAADIEQIKTKCTNLQQTCQKDDLCKENIKQLAPIFDIISRL
ncbi:hypothetical protein LI82_11380 [Methanococcoides methylutens]|uniref:Uncharacterized protein n=1 Tax=Methanococcoides methylutens TaxID=2226 RepID=A0A099SZI4_METMT|nr:hypothetical protein [Methanococcoides methylutens]KGK98310.1 hypothetical protein LI82_11380 [Methanococcoides methylutens]